MSIVEYNIRTLLKVHFIGPSLGIEGKKVYKKKSNNRKKLLLSPKRKEVSGYLIAENEFKMFKQLTAR